MQRAHFVNQVGDPHYYKRNLDDVKLIKELRQDKEYLCPEIAELKAELERLRTGDLK